MNEKKTYKWKVCVKCLTYNHASYIKDALNGFCMQETTFPYICTIVDDASTDGEQEVIKQYLQENFDLEDKLVVRNEETEDYVHCFAQHKVNKNCFFAVFYLKYNHYRKKGKIRYISEWFNNAEYIAICEGDDYWIVPDKLQKQVSFLDNHPDYTMTCNRTQLYSVKQRKLTGENYCYKCSRDISPKDIIYRTGLFISTCSIVYRKCVIDNRPAYWSKCKVGDYPLQIGCAMKGKVFYFNDIMSVYRVENSDSWMGQQKWGGENDMCRLEVIKSEVNMFKGFGNDNPTYQNLFNNKIANQINRLIPRHVSRQELKKYKEYFSTEIANYTLSQKIDMWIRIHYVPKLTGLYLKLFQSQYYISLYSH